MIMRQHIKVVAFDFDGTIVPSMEAYGRAAARLISSAYSIPEDSAYRQYMDTSGLPFPQQLDIIAPHGTRHLELVHAFEQNRHMILHQTPPEQDAASVFETLITQGIAPVISSNNTENLVTEYMERFHLPVSFVLGFRGPHFYKGAPHFRFIRNQYGATHEEIMFVADSLTDADMAALEHVHFVAKAGTFTHEQFHAKVPGCRVIDHLSEVLSFLPITPLTR